MSDEIWYFDVSEVRDLWALTSCGLVGVNRNLEGEDMNIVCIEVLDFLIWGLDMDRRVF